MLLDSVLSKNLICTNESETHCSNCSIRESESNEDLIGSFLSICTYIHIYIHIYIYITRHETN